MPLFFPPFRTGQSGSAALDRPRQRDSRAAYLGESPARLDSHIDVHTARTARLRPTDKPKFLKQRLDLQCNTAYVGSTHPVHRIKINSQLIRMLKIGGADRR